jgi:hypothetical protein
MVITHDSRRITNKSGISKGRTKQFQMTKWLKKPQPKNKHRYKSKKNSCTTWKAQNKTQQQHKNRKITNNRDLDEGRWVGATSSGAWEPRAARGRPLANGRRWSRRSMPQVVVGRGGWRRRGPHEPGRSLARAVDAPASGQRRGARRLSVNSEDAGELTCEARVVRKWARKCRSRS